MAPDGKTLSVVGYARGAWAKEPRHLRYFIAAAEAGSTTVVAARARAHAADAYASGLSRLLEALKLLAHIAPTSCPTGARLLSSRGRPEGAGTCERRGRYAVGRATRCHTARTMTAPTTEAIRPAPCPGPYQCIARPRKVATTLPMMPRIVVRINPWGLCGDGEIHRATTPAIAPITIAQMICMAPSTVGRARRLAERMAAWKWRTDGCAPCAAWGSS